MHASRCLLRLTIACMASFGCLPSLARSSHLPVGVSGSFAFFSTGLRLLPLLLSLLLLPLRTGWSLGCPCCLPGASTLKLRLRLATPVSSSLLQIRDSLAWHAEGGCQGAAPGLSAQLLSLHRCLPLSALLQGCCSFLQAALPALLVYQRGPPGQNSECGLLLACEGLGSRAPHRLRLTAGLELAGSHIQGPRRLAGACQVLPAGNRRELD